MQASFSRRVVLKFVLIALVAFIAVFIRDNANTVFASFSPIYTATLSGTGAGAIVDVTTEFDVNAPDLNFGTVVTFTPKDATLPGAPAPAVGDIAGTIHSLTTLGLSNLPCGPNEGLTLDFAMMNATTDTTQVVFPSAFADAGPEGTLQPLRQDTYTIGGTGNAGAGSVANTVANGLPAHVDRYPSYNNTLFNNIAPIQRYSGSLVVASSAVVVQFLVFAPGALNATNFPPPSLLSDLGDVNLGYPAVTVLQDPTATAAPSTITDFCTGLGSTTKLYGHPKDNTCNGNPAAPCNTEAKINTPCATAADCAALAGNANVRYKNPAVAGTYRFLAFAQSLRDLDEDGLENSFDTCAYTPTPAYNPRAADAVNDSDSDMIPGGGPAGGCDPTVGNTGSGDHDGDGWQNAGDNCPLSANPSGLDTDGLGSTATSTSTPRGGPKGDSVGDACDKGEGDPTNPCENGTVACGTAGACTNAVDDDKDGLVNDGCPAVGANGAEIGCLNDVNDDPAADDTVVNDGCPSSNTVSTGPFHTVLSVMPVCIGGIDGDGDGYCTVATGPIPADPDDTNSAKTPEAFSMLFSFPVADAGSGEGSITWNPVPNPAAIPVGKNRAGEPYQVCNDGINNDGDGGTDLQDPSNGCMPTGLPLHPGYPTCAATGCDLDYDGDGYTNAAEILIGTDPLGRCDVGVTGGVNSNPSRDWPSDFASGGAFGSTDKWKTDDLTSILAPVRHMSTSPGDGGFDARWDLKPGKGIFTTWINVDDLTAEFSGASGNPPMFNGARVSTGTCTAHPTYGD